eukprot:CAMPEP_0172163786 /NCGR_PEP_ID=MMETSP1050-20130122/7464_1 /TAXON_ID=233186 /ORGANISM="Cryptomonas curvata, Strain CCAP979/52" /LENGTH=662 /DNA_ID=CAMNT_0012834013 /DNA_START=291 /DNA_END=2276 /DNA_ORIENTATION=+
MSLGTFSNRAVLAGMLAVVLIVETVPSARAGNSNHHSHSRRKDLARHHLGVKAHDSLQDMLKAPLIHLAETTDDCEKSVFYEACIPALFGQGCTRFPVTGPCESQFCPRNCTGHGHCDERNLEASCACEAGFTGHFCATQLCPEDCSGHGRCHALYGTCDCDAGFGGAACSDVLCPSNCTQPNGVCDLQTGICTCQTGFSGVDCSQEPRQLYNESWGVVFALTLVGICTIFIYLINLSKLRFLPDSISAIIIGAIIGLIIRFMGVNENRHLITVRPTSIFLFFLPMIMFESGYGLKKTSFFKNFPTILVFAVFGTVISGAVVGLGIYYLGEHGLVYRLSFLNSVVFGALLASTDPVATLAIFQALKVDSTLYMIAFGESVLNDAVAIVLFESILAQFYINQEHHSLAHFPIQFVFTFTASILIGVACALFAALTFKHLRLRELSTASLEISLMLVFSYMPYLLAASTRLSGIMAIFSAGIIMSHYTQWNLSDEARKVTSSMFRTLAFAAETFLFAYIGLSAVIFNYTNAFKLAGYGLLLCMAGRALNIFPLALIVNQFRTNRISFKVQFVLWFSGLRGIISFALALNVPGADHDVIAAATLLIVITTIVVFGGGTVPTLRALGMINEADRVYVSKTAQEQERDALLRRDDRDGAPSTYGTDP